MISSRMMRILESGTDSSTHLHEARSVATSVYWGISISLLFHKSWWARRWAQIMYHRLLIC